MAHGVQHDVVGLQIPVHNASLVQVLEGELHLRHVHAREPLVEAFVVLDQSLQVAAAAVLEHQYEVGWRLESVVQPDDEGMLDVGQHVALGEGVPY